MTTLKQSDWTGHKNDISVATDAAGRVDFVLASGAEAAHTVIEDAVRTLKGEIQLDLDCGVDYEKTIWRGRSRINAWKRSVTEELEKFAFVDRIEDITAWMRTDRELGYDIKVRLKDGTISEVRSKNEE